MVAFTPRIEQTEQKHERYNSVQPPWFEGSVTGDEQLEISEDVILVFDSLVSKVVLVFLVNGDRRALTRIKLFNDANHIIYSKCLYY